MNIQSSPTSISRLGLFDGEIERRLHLFDFTDRAQQDLRDFQPVLAEHSDDVINRFYERQLESPEIAAIIGEKTVLERLRGVMTNFILTLFQATYDEAYITGRLHIGAVHKSLGVTPKLYMAGVSTLQEVLEEAIDAHCPADLDARALRDALHKALLFDSQLVFDAYIDGYQQEMERAREEVHHYAAKLEIKVDALTRELHEQSIRDGLTGLYNRLTFHETLEREIKVAERYKLPLCLAYFDLNGFKAVNDTFGHGAGDKVLAQVGESLRATMRSVDVTSRFGGDEFCVIMPRCDLAETETPMKRLMEHFDQACEHDVTFSIGVSQCGPDQIKSVEDLIHEADSLMYAAKARSRKEPGHQIKLAK